MLKVPYCDGLFLRKENDGYLVFRVETKDRRIGYREKLIACLTSLRSVQRLFVQPAKDKLWNDAMRVM